LTKKYLIAVRSRVKRKKNWLGVAKMKTFSEQFMPRLACKNLRAEQLFC
jgi:hypothetical protein